MRSPVALVALSLLAACRSTPEAVGTVISTTPPPPRTVAVTGTAEIETTPDGFVISVGIDSFAGDAAKAKADNDGVMRALMEVPKHFDVDAKWIRTEGFSINPRFEGSWEARRVVGFEAHKTLVITLHDEKKVEPVLEGLFRDGANRLDGVRFKSQRILEQRKEARTRAVAQAREKAEAMAAVLGQKVARPLKMEETPEAQTWPWTPQPQSNAVFNNDTRSELREAMATGKIRIPATVSVTFELADG
jgi:uncharacterized protein YggE